MTKKRFLPDPIVFKEKFGLHLGGRVEALVMSDNQMVLPISDFRRPEVTGSKDVWASEYQSLFQQVIVVNR